jgi:hypothetical protein
MRRKSTTMVGPMCELCSKTNCKLHVHHRDENPANDAPSNLQTLCVSCHRLSHSPNYTGTPPRRIACTHCSKLVARKGLCNTHLTRLKRHGSPLAKKVNTASGWQLTQVSG